MSTTKVAITIDEDLLTRLDHLVAERQFPSRSRAIAEAVREKLSRMDRNRLARECAKLDTRFEQVLADEGLAQDLTEWPEYWIPPYLETAGQWTTSAVLGEDQPNTDALGSSVGKEDWPHIV